MFIRDLEGLRVDLRVQEQLQVTLAISLHAANDEVQKKYEIIVNIGYSLYPIFTIYIYIQI